MIAGVARQERDRPGWQEGRVEFQALVRTRRMVRDFDLRPLPAGALERILENAARAPSAGFTQGWEFLLLEDEHDRERFWNIEWPVDERGAHRHLGVLNAPVLIVPISDKGAYLDRYARPDKGWTDRAEERWPVPYWHIDTAFATMLMLLTAVDAGLGALFFRLRHTDEFHAAFGVPDDYEPIGAVALGYPAPRTKSAASRRRRQLAGMVHRGRW